MEHLRYVIAEMAYDNGAVFRGQTVGDVLANVFKELKRSDENPDGFSLVDLQCVENMLAVMTTEHQALIVTGEHTEIQDVVKSYGFSIIENMLLDEVLNTAFEYL